MAPQSQGAALNPASGNSGCTSTARAAAMRLTPEAGKNTLACNRLCIDYSGAKIHESTHSKAWKQPIYQWNAGDRGFRMAFYQGDVSPMERPSLHRRTGVPLRGAPRAQRRQGDKEERILRDLNERIRDVAPGRTAHFGCSPTIRPAACARRAAKP